MSPSSCRDRTGDARSGAPRSPLAEPLALATAATAVQRHPISIARSWREPSEDGRQEKGASPARLLSQQFIWHLHILRCRESGPRHRTRQAEGHGKRRGRGGVRTRPRVAAGYGRCICIYAACFLFVPLSLFPPPYKSIPQTSFQPIGVASVDGRLAGHWRPL